MINAAVGVGLALSHARQKLLFVFFAYGQAFDPRCLSGGIREASMIQTWQCAVKFSLTDFLINFRTLSACKRIHCLHEAAMR
jgi:hypothetical protein